MVGFEVGALLPVRDSNSSQAPANDLFWFVFGIIVVSAVVVVCYFWLDRPIAVWVHARMPEHSSQQLEPLTQFPNPLNAVSTAAYLLIGFAALARKIHLRLRVIAACSVSAAMGELVKNEMKWVFGRSWPESWSKHPSFIQDHAYGFHWFGGGGVYNSFPSGHMTWVLAVVSILWVCFPRWRPAHAAIGASAAALLVGTNLHFLGDVIAGAALGAAMGVITVRLFVLDQPRGWINCAPGGGHPTGSE